MKKKNICYILRGLPGTGKSTLARLLSAANTPEYYKHHACLDSFHVRTFSTDDLFINEEGVYEFDADMLKWHHQENLRRAIEFFNLHPETANAPNWAQIAIIDNTNVQQWEYQPYIEAAEEAGWDVQIITLDWNEHDIPLYAKRNKHGVPEEAIRRMADRWEFYRNRYSYEDRTGRDINTAWFETKLKNKTTT